MSFLDLSDKYITNNKFLLWFPFKASDTNLKKLLEEYSADDSQLKNLIRILRRNEQKATTRRNTKKKYLKDARGIVSGLMGDSDFAGSKADAGRSQVKDTSSQLSEGRKGGGAQSSSSENQIHDPADTTFRRKLSKPAKKRLVKSKNKQ
jgi:hypothetical protein